jgi:hypothetical protein
MTQVAAEKLPGYKKASNNPHITLSHHIANLDVVGQQKMIAKFNELFENKLLNNRPLSKLVFY